MDWMAVEGSLACVDYRVMAVDPYRLVIMRDREGENFLMKLFFALHKPEEFDNTPHRHCHAMSILLVCNIKCYSTTLYFAC